MHAMLTLDLGLVILAGVPVLSTLAPSEPAVQGLDTTPHTPCSLPSLLHRLLQVT